MPMHTDGISTGELITTISTAAASIIGSIFARQAPTVAQPTAAPAIVQTTQQLFRGPGGFIIIGAIVLAVFLFRPGRR